MHDVILKLKLHFLYYLHFNTHEFHPMFDKIMLCRCTAILAEFRN